uniref:30S ribosomal protein S14, chloroplastic n=1 Tax=Epipogium roseum TaxID=556037 RepID=A0A0B4N509_9ASPA|nr:ribosomal protein S14 [Epipogium roseum]AII78959.1 ribosomal protein S14 [Epipogium roseum]AIS35794.1 ribosomal protein S14 [Epipogium roseum]
MGIKGFIQRDNKRKKLVYKYYFIRKTLKKELSIVHSIKEKHKIHLKLQSLPRNSTTTRINRRCFLTGSTRSNFRYFGLSGHIIRKMFNKCLLPGTTRSS